MQQHHLLSLAKRRSQSRNNNNNNNVRKHEQPFAKIPFLADMRASKRETTKAPTSEENQLAGTSDESSGGGDRLKAFRTHTPRPPRPFWGPRAGCVRTDQMANHDMESFLSFVFPNPRVTAPRAVGAVFFLPPQAKSQDPRAPILALRIVGKASNGGGSCFSFSLQHRSTLLLPNVRRASFVQNGYCKHTSAETSRVLESTSVLLFSSPSTPSDTHMRASSYSVD